MTNDIQEIIETLAKFNDDRDWEQFHNANIEKYSGASKDGRLKSIIND